MKIAFYMTTVLEHGGGLEKYLIETASQLSRRPGVEADVITMDNAFTERITSALQLFYFKKIDKKLSFKENSEDVKRRLMPAHYFKMHTIKELRERLRAYDVIYSKNELLEAFVFSFLVGYKNVPPVVFGGHTPLHYPNPQTFHAKLHNFLYTGPLYRFLASKVNKYHVLNNHEEEIYKNLFKAHKVFKIYNPFDAQAFRHQAAEKAYNLNFKPGALKVLWLGRLTEQKGVDDLVSVIDQTESSLSAAESPFAWTVVGDGEQRSLAEALAARRSNVTYLGYIDQKYVSSIYAAHDVFISTSQWEGYPYNLLEASAWGLYILAYDIPGTSDILSAYNHGALAADRQDMVNRLIGLAQDDLVKNRGEAPARFHPDFAYDQLMQLLTPEAGKLS